MQAGMPAARAALAVASVLLGAALQISDDGLEIAVEGLDVSLPGPAGLFNNGVVHHGVTSRSSSGVQIVGGR